jgi:hypothetical protein
MQDQSYPRRVFARIVSSPKPYIILGAAAIALAQNPRGTPFLWYPLGVMLLGIAVWRFVCMLRG